MQEYLEQSQLNFNPQAQKVSIIVRNVRKQAKIISAQSQIWPEDFLQIVSTSFQIPVQRIILFYNGFRIDNYGLPVGLTDQSIMHLIDKDNLDKNFIKVTFKSLFNAPILKHSFDSNSEIGLIASNYLARQYSMQPSKFFMVYAGRTLNHSSTLKDEFVQNEAQLIVIKYKSINDSFQKEAIQYDSSMRGEPVSLSSIKITTPASFNTSFELIQKKNKLQASLNQSNKFLNAGPLPVINQVPPNISEVRVVFVENSLKTAPNGGILYQSQESPQPKQNLNEPQINVLTDTTHSAPKQQLQVNNKAILQLQSHYHNIRSNQIQVMPILKNDKNEKDSFIDEQSSQKANK